MPYIGRLLLEVETLGAVLLVGEWEDVMVYPEDGSTSETAHTRRRWVNGLRKLAMSGRLTATCPSARCSMASAFAANVAVSTTCTTYMKKVSKDEQGSLNKMATGQPSPMGRYPSTKSQMCRATSGFSPSSAASLLEYQYNFLSSSVVVVHPCLA